MIKTGLELAQKCKDVALNHKTLYVMGCFGAPMTDANKERYCDEYSYNRKESRTAMIRAASADTFGFDCVCLIKGLLWGWGGDTVREYGGAKYQSNGVPDIDTEQMIAVCSGVSSDFSNIEVGEVVWMKGHIGVYIGNGLAVECTPAWKNMVQITAVLNIGAKSGYNGRRWTKHGKLPYVKYEKETTTTTTETKEWGECKVNVKVLKKGAKGEAVKALQALLIGYGYKMTSGNVTYGVDGSFGGATDQAVRAFQKDKGLDADGSVGPATWAKLLGV